MFYSYPPQPKRRIIWEHLYLSSNQRLKDRILEKKDPPCVAAEEGVKGFLLFAQSWSLQINLSLSLIRILTEHGPFFAHFWFKWVKWKITEKSEPADTAKGYKEVKYKLVLSNSSWTASSQVCCAQKHAKFCNKENILILSRIQKQSWNTCFSCAPWLIWFWR